MVTDLLGRTVNVGDAYLLGGRVSRINEDGTISVVLDMGQLGQRSIIVPAANSVFADDAANGLTGIVPIERGGTSAADASGARTALGLGSAATSDGAEFADAAHNHDADYAGLGHTHDTEYRRTVQSEHGDPVRTICSNTTTEETALSYTIPADTLATHDVYYEIEFDVLQNHGSTVANRMRINLGATEAHSSSSSWTQNDPDRFQVSMWGTISSRGATNKQRVSWQAMAGTPISAGGQWINGDQRGNGANDTAEDSTGDLTFEVTFQWSATQSNGNFRIFRTRIELVPQ